MLGAYLKLVSYKLENINNLKKINYDNKEK